MPCGLVVASGLNSCGRSSMGTPGPLSCTVIRRCSSEAIVQVAGVLAGKTERKLTLHLKGGDLYIEWRENNRVYMTGGAEEVFHGQVKIL